MRHFCPIGCWHLFNKEDEILSKKRSQISIRTKKLDIWDVHCDGLKHSSITHIRLITMIITIIIFGCFSWHPNLFSSSSAIIPIPVNPYFTHSSAPSFNGHRYVKLRHSDFTLQSARPHACSISIHCITNTHHKNDTNLERVWSRKRKLKEKKKTEKSHQE